MKKLLIVMTFFILLTSCSIGAEQKLSIDLIKCEVNGYSLKYNSKEILDLFGKPYSVIYYYNGEWEYVYARLGLSWLTPGAPSGQLTINLNNSELNNDNYKPYIGELSFGITAKTKIEELPDLFKGYTLVCKYHGDSLDYYSIDLKTHKVDIYCDSITHNLLCLFLSY